MSATSSSPDGWWSLLEPAPAEAFYHRGDPEDPRLGEVVCRFTGEPVELRPGQPVLVGFPCDQGVRRNGGRAGAAQAPDAIRRQLYRLTSWDPAHPSSMDRTYVIGLRLDILGLLDAGNLRLGSTLEQSQERLGIVVAALLAARAVPIVIGGGHETAFGHYLGYANVGRDCCILNVDAHLDVRRYEHGAHSGSPFRQAFEHPTHPLQPERYVVFGAQAHNVAKSHLDYMRERRSRIVWWNTIRYDVRAIERFSEELTGLVEDHSPVLLTVDADAFRQADVPGVSAPNPLGLDGTLFSEMASLAGLNDGVNSLEVVEVNPIYDRDEQTTRWAAVGIRQFLVGLAGRPS